MPNEVYLKESEDQNEKKEKKIPKINILLLVFFAVALIYTIIMLIKTSFEKPVVFYKNNLEQYISEDKLITTTYFYVVDLQVANFLEAVAKEKYDELYEILDEKYKKIYSKNDIIKYLKDYRENVFIYDKSTAYTEHVENVYKIDENKSLVQLDFNNKEFYIIISSGRKGYNFIIVE